MENKLDIDILDARNIEGWTPESLSLTMKQLEDSWNGTKPKFILAQPDDINNEFIL